MAYYRSAGSNTSPARRTSSNFLSQHQSLLRTHIPTRARNLFINLSWQVIMPLSDQAFEESPQKTTENDETNPKGHVGAPEEIAAPRKIVFSDITAEDADQIIGSTKGALVDANKISVKGRRQWLIDTSPETLQRLDENYTEILAAEQQHSTKSSRGRFERACKQVRKFE